MHICLSAGGPSSWVWFIPENDSDSELVFNYKKRIPAILILKGLVLFLQLGLNKWRGLFFGLLASFFPSMFQLIKEPHTSFTNPKWSNPSRPLSIYRVILLLTAWCPSNFNNSIFWNGCSKIAKAMCFVLCR